MATDDPRPGDPLTDLGNAFVRFLKWLVTLVIETAAQHGRRDGPRYYDRKTFPWGERSFQRLTGQGKLRSFKAPDGKTILVLRDEAHAFIEAQEGAPPRAPRPPPFARAAPPVDVNALSPAEAHELVMGRDPKQGPTTERSPRPRHR
ncbi:hypothetical protein KEG38_43040 [Polyangium jinanense]|uniref:hypothetical protein n=1 Tax=Polyangium jinanense TaxID=2829994 RepID=UPI002340CF38|nr:hypothetical protein [Polyangium jinanense]MDC3960707.1 hypothetical protein [Polyangium jinanense]